MLLQYPSLAGQVTRWAQRDTEPHKVYDNLCTQAGNVLLASDIACCRHLNARDQMLKVRNTR